jgi:predicted ATP-grasp superfamily ATP-dependent carboligase
MELFEELSGANLLDIHLEALVRGRLPAGPLPADRFLAKRILYATRPVRWSSPAPGARLDVRDRPAERETIGAGHPICTLVARGVTPGQCRRILAKAAGRLRRALHAGGRAAPPAPRRRAHAALSAARGSVLG